LVTLWLVKPARPGARSAGSGVLTLLGMKTIERQLAGGYIAPERIPGHITYAIVVLIASTLLSASPVVKPFAYSAF
jgi:hypothetical protein